MHRINTDIKGLYLYEIERHRDNRGMFIPLYVQSYESSIDHFVQQNISISKCATIRGMHGSYNMAKLVTCVSGSIYDCVVDMRGESPTYCKTYSITLGPNEENFYSLYIPRGFLHGFQALEDNTVVAYSQTKIYREANQFNVNYTDKTLDIQWPLPNPILSTQDLEAKGLFV